MLVMVVAIIAAITPAVEVVQEVHTHKKLNYE